MSIAPAKLPKTLLEPPFWGPDGRYRPPVENGELPAELPGHLELPEENGEIVENFRETPQSDSCSIRSSGRSSSGSIPTSISHWAMIAGSTGGWPTRPSEGSSARTGSMCRACLLSSGVISAVPMCSGRRTSGPP